MSTTCGRANGSLFARLGFMAFHACDKQQKRRKNGAPGTRQWRSRISSVGKNRIDTFRSQGDTQRTMTEVQTTTQRAGDTRLWRYLSLDKLVDLLSTSELFFTPLATFAKTDPFEGYLPSVALDAFASVSRNQVNALEQSHHQVAEYRNKRGYPLTNEERKTLQASLEDYRSTYRRLLPAIAKTTMVNCWHASESESEAMWRIYAENGKAVAVETTLDALRESIQKRESSSVVFIYPVRYLDFFDSSLQPRDCVVEGHLIPLLKRISYEYEHEVRAFIAKVAPNPRAGADISFWKPAPIRLPIDVRALVKAIHISPYAEEPFPSSVVKICEAFGLKSGIVRSSRLLSGHEELLDRLSLSGS